MQYVLPLAIAGKYKSMEQAYLWALYLHRKKGDSLDRIVFQRPDTEIVQAFINSQTTYQIQMDLLNEIKPKLLRNLNTIPANQSSRIDLENFFEKSWLKNFKMNFNIPDEIAGNIAGGMGSSDAGMDRRELSGYITVDKKVNEKKEIIDLRVKSQFTFKIFDAIDFCPGDMGTVEEQRLTIPLSRLEAGDLSYDVPFLVIYNAPQIEQIWFSHGTNSKEAKTR